MKHQGFQRFSDAQTAVVYIHGILGSPIQFRKMDDKIKALGADGYAVLLPGHGMGGRHFYRSTPVQWLEHCCAEIQRMREKYAKLILIGHSMGGLLGLLYASEHPVEGLVLINTPQRIHVTRRMLSMGARSVFCKPKENEEEYMRAYRENYGVENPKLYEYPLFFKPMLGLQKLIRQTNACLGGVKAPVLIIQSKQDETVAPVSAQLLLNALGSSAKRVVYLKDSFHVYFPSGDETLMMQHIFTFIQKIMKQS